VTTAGPLHPERLELGEELGVGAVATVYRATDRLTGERHALKLLHDRNARDPRASRRFTREAELARTLVDPHIVAVRGAIEFQARQALLMELVEGPTLAELIAREAPFDERRLITLARDISRGLSVAHAGGVIHRDLKPANVLIARAGEHEIAKIADFGMARATSFAGVDRESMTVLGTPDYMAPETLDPLAVDPRTDLYALGCIMIEMATGRPPFAAATPFAVLDAHRKRPPPPLPERYSAPLRELVEKLLAKQPSDRPQAASAVVEVLDALLRGKSGSTALVPTAGALARVPPRDLLQAASAGRCARCGEPVVQGVRVCLACGLSRVRIEPGHWTVFVVGPGLVGDKFDSTRRDALLTWLRANPDSGLEIGKFAERIPRLPFPLVLRLSEASARAMTESLAQLGIHAEPRPGGRFAHEQMTEKVFRIGARRSKVALVVLMFMLPLLFLALPLLPVYFAAIAAWTSMPALTANHTARLALPPRIDERLREVERAAPSISARHLPGLRAVVQRVMALTTATPVEQRTEIDAEMAHALAVATVASVRMSELDMLVSRPDFDAGELEHRRDLQERDMWSARMLELTATLDALVARIAAAKSALRGATIEDRSELEQLRHNIEALEEVSLGGPRALGGGETAEQVSRR
jgi:tRNA A-37 threonylcarbamoyl transferase component Bud32